MAWRGEGKPVPWAPPSSRASLLSCWPGGPQQVVPETAAPRPTVSERSSWLGERLALPKGVLLSQGVLRRLCRACGGRVWVSLSGVGCSRAL